MATRTVTDIVTRTIFTSGTPSSTVRAAPQGGILDGANPTTYDPKNPIILFIIQAGIVISLCRLLHWPLSKLKQPRVIAEVIGGILLGPSVMGRIPGFTDHIFPTASLPNFTLVANIGLVLFLFLVGLEVDLRFLVRNWRVAISVGLGGMALPFGLGCAVAWGLYNEFRDEPGTVKIDFTTYMLFIGVAMAITAFPVLCRILTELKLLSTPVGIIVLSAGVGNDVTGWILLALCVALVNAGDGLTALWVLLCCVGWTIFLIYGVRPVFMWVLRRTRSLTNGPTQGVIALTLMIALTSSFFTGVIGVHPIFGAFLAGLICPHEGGFAIKVTEKVEDLVSTLFLPLYFALSGLSTNLGLLDTGVTWAYVFAVLFIAFFAKVIGGSGAARLNGLVWRECFSIGALMSCKGLVELIVLNIGLQAKILSQRTFTIFVVMALITTFATTPLTIWLYPPWYQKKLEAWKRGEIEWDSGRRIDGGDDEDAMAVEKLEASCLDRLLLYLRLDSMPGLLALTALVGGQPRPSILDQTKESSAPTTALRPAETEPTEKLNRNATRARRQPEIHALRLHPVTQRDSSVMRVSEITTYDSAQDSVSATFQAFNTLCSVDLVNTHVAVVPEDYYAEAMINHAENTGATMMILPWSDSGSLGETSNVFPGRTTRSEMGVGIGYNTIGWDELERSTSGTSTHPVVDRDPRLEDNAQYREFVGRIIPKVRCNLAVLIDNGFMTRNKSGSNSVDPFTYHPLQRQRTQGSVDGLKKTGSRIAGSTAVPQTPSEPKTYFVNVVYFGSRDDRLAVRFALRLLKHRDIKVQILHLEYEGQSSNVRNSAGHEHEAASQRQLHVGKSKITASAMVASADDKSEIFITTVLSSLVDTDESSRVQIKKDSIALPETVERNARPLLQCMQRSFGFESLTTKALFIIGHNGVVANDLQAQDSPNTSACLGGLGEALVREPEFSTRVASLLVVKAAPVGRDTED